MIDVDKPVAVGVPVAIQCWDGKTIDRHGDVHRQRAVDAAQATGNTLRRAHSFFLYPGDKFRPPRHVAAISLLHDRVDRLFILLCPIALDHSMSLMPRVSRSSAELLSF